MNMCICMYMCTCTCVCVRVVVEIVVVVDEEHGQRYTCKRRSWREARRSKNILNIVTNLCELQSTDKKQSQTKEHNPKMIVRVNFI